VSNDLFKRIEIVGITCQAVTWPRVGRSTQRIDRYIRVILHEKSDVGLAAKYKPGKIFNWKNTFETPFRFMGEAQKWVRKKVHIELTIGCQ